MVRRHFLGSLVAARASSRVKVDPHPVTPSSVKTAISVWTQSSGRISLAHPPSGVPWRSPADRISVIRIAQPRREYNRFHVTAQFLWQSCQGKVEMSPSRQNRNVPFSLDLGGVHVNLRVPVKRRLAMLASNPIKE